jgi:hypothetical protein
MGLEHTPKSRKRRQEFEQRQAKRWAKKNGPVTVRFVDPATLRPATAESAGEGATTSSYGSAGERRVDAAAASTSAPSSIVDDDQVDELADPAGGDEDRPAPAR